MDKVKQCEMRELIMYVEQRATKSEEELVY